MKKILLIRHPETKAPQRFYGSTDIDLSQNGKKQAGQLKERLSAEKIEIIYSSDRYRTFYPAHIISKEYKIDHLIDVRLREINFGQWEGLTFDEIGQRDNELLKCWLDTPETFIFPQGEKMGVFLERIQSAFNEIEATNTFKTIAIITHGGVIKTLLSILLHRTIKAIWEIPQGFGAINMIEYGEKEGIVRVINDTSYLVQLP